MKCPSMKHKHISLNNLGSKHNLVIKLIKSNMSSLLQIFHFPIEVMLNSLQTQKSLELVWPMEFTY